MKQTSQYRMVHKGVSKASRPLRQLGLTLIELLVSMVISLIVLAGVVQMMVDNKSKFRLADEVSFIQENARFAIDELGRELRMAGFAGCGAGADVANVVNDGTSFYDGLGIEGWDGSEDAANFPDAFSADLWASGAASAPDAFVVRRLNTDNASIIDKAAPNTNASAVIKILDEHDYEQGSILVATNQDCTQVSIFQHTGIGDDQYIHNTGNAVDPGNCTKDLFGTGDCADQADLTQKNFGGGGMVAEFSARAYYIGPSSIDATIPSLYAERLQAQGGNSITTAEELLIGVENMQVKYGVDTDAIIDGQADRYVDADVFPDAANNIEWERVVSVRLELLMRSLDGIWGDDTTFVFEGVNYTDRMLRQRVGTTVLLRNLAVVE